MTEPNPDAERNVEDLKADQSRSDGGFHVVVGVLLLMIIFALAALWIIERRNHHNAVQAIKGLQEHAKELRGQNRQFNDMLQKISQHPGIPRDLLTTRPVRLNGDSVHVLVLPPEMAVPLGLNPGDTVVVPATQSAEK
jgi:hypothetical protein